MTPISGQDDLKDFLRLHINQQFAIGRQEGWGEVIQILRRKSADMAAMKIMEAPRLFKLDSDKGFGTLTLDAIVLTYEEYMAICRKQFRAGIDHAHGFAPLCYEVKA